MQVNGVGCYIAGIADQLSNRPGYSLSSFPFGFLHQPPRGLAPYFDLHTDSSTGTKTDCPDRPSCQTGCCLPDHTVCSLGKIAPRQSSIIPFGDERGPVCRDLDMDPGLGLAVPAAGKRHHRLHRKGIGSCFLRIPNFRLPVHAFQMNIDPPKTNSWRSLLWKGAELLSLGSAF